MIDLEKATIEADAIHRVADMDCPWAPTYPMWDGDTREKLHAIADGLVWYAERLNGPAPYRPKPYEHTADCPCTCCT